MRNTAVTVVIMAFVAVVWSNAMMLIVVIALHGLIRLKARLTA